MGAGGSSAGSVRANARANNTMTTGSAGNNAGPDQMNAASQMAAQLQFSQLLMSMGLAGMGFITVSIWSRMEMTMPRPPKAPEVERFISL